MKEKLNRLARRITLRQLRALAAVVETGTVTGAADRLAVTAPAISAQIRLLEDLSGLPLIERQAQGMTATRAGRELLAAFELIEAALSDCTAALESLCGGEGGPVAVGVTSTAKYFAPFALAAFARQRPAVELRLVVGNRSDTIAALERFELDLAVMGRPPEHFAVERAAIGDHPHVVIAAPDHPLVRRRGLTLADLTAQTFLMREAGSGTRLLLERLLAEAGLAAQVGMEISSNETIKQAVMAGMGVAFLSAHTAAAEIGDGRLALLDIVGLPAIRQWFVVRRREKRLLPAAQELWNHLASTGARYLPVLPALRDMVGTRVEGPP
ncbi:MAG: LysR family transcriptional regulator [Geminicoccaceae bacterium]